MNISWRCLFPLVGRQGQYRSSRMSLPHIWPFRLLEIRWRQSPSRKLLARRVRVRVRVRVSVSVSVSVRIRDWRTSSSSRWSPGKRLLARRSFSCFSGIFIWNRYVCVCLRLRIDRYVCVWCAVLKAAACTHLLSLRLRIDRYVCVRLRDNRWLEGQSVLLFDNLFWQRC
jgi:hypothetical protein